MKNEFTLKISPRMLEILSQELYTNVYFVLAELIANAYDADAENVYIFIDKNEIRVEDDGKGMSPDEIDNHYLIIGSESRKDDATARTPKFNRLKMGRKGVGKLAALSIANSFKLISIQNKIRTGIIIPKRIEKENESLHLLTDDEYTLLKIKEHGTAIIMEDPIISIPKSKQTIINNLSKIFPKVINNFSIHIIFQGEESLMLPNEKDIFGKLSSLITIGDTNKLIEYLDKDDKDIQHQSHDEKVIPILMKNNKNETIPVDIKIKGWIATYKSTRGQKREIYEFSDNYIAIFAHNKMGQRNVLDFVEKNRIYDKYIVGHFYIDIFEDSDLPDMAATNRQGYNESDPRWIESLKYIRDLTDHIVNLHSEYARLKQAEILQEKQKQQKQREDELKEKLIEVSKQMVNGITSHFNNTNIKDIEKIIQNEVEAMKPILELKSNVDASKKKIIISQTLADKKIADIIYNMLLYNGVPKEDIIYSNCNDYEANLPEKDIYDYLRKFFVESVSTQMIYVIFILSKNVYHKSKENAQVSWGVLMEIGAAWITQSDHAIFNINEFEPLEPLNVRNKWVAIKNESNLISMSAPMINSFCKKIIDACQICGYSNYKTFDQNKSHLLKEYVEEYKP